MVTEDCLQIFCFVTPCNLVYGRLCCQCLLLRKCKQQFPQKLQYYSCRLHGGTSQNILGSLQSLICVRFGRGFSLLIRHFLIHGKDILTCPFADMKHTAVQPSCLSNSRTSGCGNLSQHCRVFFSYCAGISMAMEVFGNPVNTLVTNYMHHLL